MSVDQQVPDLPGRPEEGHKGTFGTVVVAAGSTGMAGAAALCARAVLRAGAGLCQVWCPEPVQPQVAVLVPCATTVAVPGPAGHFDPEAVEAVAAAADRTGILALGPGLGAAPATGVFVRRLLETTRATVILDADGLNVLGPLAARALVRPAGAGPVVATPHPGEAARLLDRPVDRIQADRRASALELAGLFGGVAVLKGAGTVVAAGGQAYVNATGGPGLATGGSGDVLTGLIAGLAAQGMDPEKAAILGVWLHGRAGDLGTAELTSWCLTAEDLLARLPAAFADRAGAGS